MNRSHIYTSRNFSVGMFVLLLLAGIFCLTSAVGSVHAGNIFYCGYDTNLGQLDLVVEVGSDIVQGSYPAKSGTISGFLQEGVFRGQWRQAKTKNTCKTIDTLEDEHISIVVSKKWTVYKSGEDDRQRAFDYCYDRRGPCYLLVQVGPDGVVEKNKVNFSKLKTSTGRQPANLSAKYKSYFASSEKDLWNGLLSDFGSDIDKEMGNKVASTVLSLFKNAEKPKRTGRISLDLRFDSDSSAIRKPARPILNKLGNLLRKEKDVRILIRGHNSGKSSMIPLSLARARSVKAYLVKNYDIDPKRIKTEGLGNSEPLVREKTKGAYLVNQRVDVEML